MIIEILNIKHLLRIYQICYCPPGLATAKNNSSSSHIDCFFGLLTDFAIKLISFFSKLETPIIN